MHALSLVADKSGNCRLSYAAGAQDTIFRVMDGSTEFEMTHTIEVSYSTTIYWLKFQLYFMMDTLQVSSGEVRRSLLAHHATAGRCVCNVSHSVRE